MNVLDCSPDRVTVTPESAAPPIVIRPEMPFVGLPHPERTKIMEKANIAMIHK